MVKTQKGHSVGPDLHPDLIKRLSEEAGDFRTAHVFNEALDVRRLLRIVLSPHKLGKGHAVLAPNHEDLDIVHVVDGQLHPLSGGSLVAQEDYAAG